MWTRHAIFRSHRWEKRFLSLDDVSADPLLVATTAICYVTSNNERLTHFECRIKHEQFYRQQPTHSPQTS